MADFPDPVDNFLKSFFMVRNGTMDRQLKIQEAQLAQQKFQWEQANHQADMAQRAKQFQDEMDLRQKQQANTEAYQKAMLDEQKATRADASQERFRAAGGQLFNTPTDKTFDLGTSAPQTLPNPASILMPRADTQPVGPQVPLSVAQQNNPIQQLPLGGNTQIPLQMTLPAEAQLPDPERYRPTQAPLGTPEGMQAYFPTLKGKTLETKEAQDEANQMVVTPEMERVFGDLGLKSGSTVDRSLLPLMENAATRQLTRQSNDLNRQTMMMNANDQKDRDRDLKLVLAQMAADKKAQGGLGPQALSNAVKSVMQNPDNFETHSPKTREAIENELEEKFGLPAPTKLSTQNKSQETAALNSKAQIQTFENMLKDPDIVKNIGPAIGRYEDLVQGKIGSTAGFTPEVAQKVQQFRSALTYMLFSEGKQLMPGRISSQLIGLLKETSPNPRQALPVLNGSLAAVKGNANNFLTAAEKERWGGKMRPDFIQSLYPERTPVKVGDDVKKSIRPGTAVNVGGHNIYHDPDDDKFYEVSK